jgi:ATP/maltotriose-dependent transcriptional regulator MalT
MMRLLDWLIGRAPPHLHILLATRFPLQLPHLLHWRVRGELLEIGQDELAFNALEIARLFGEQAGASLTPAQSEQIAARTEGWAIALSLILRQLTGRPPVEFADALARLSADEGDLFSYLAHEVLADLPEDVRAFMRVTSILRELDAPACDYLRRQRDSDAILRHLEENSLFVIQLGPGQLRYHPLFRDLLSSQLSQLEAQAAHNRAAAYYRVMGDEEAIIHHLLAAGSFAAAAELISEVGRKWVRRGRLDMLTDWIAALPPEILESRPMLLSLLGDVARLHSHFEEALAWYQQAEARARAQHDLHTAGQALRGQARVYLDTVNPSKADELLQEALRLSDGQESRESRAHLLELLAENLLNRGQMEAARRYQEQARTLPATRSDKKPAAIRPLALGWVLNRSTTNEVDVSPSTPLSAGIAANKAPRPHRRIRYPLGAP